MTETVGGFCRDLLDEHEQGRRLDPEIIAARFVEYFRVSARPTLEELEALVRRAGFGEVEEMSLEEGLKGVHFGTPGEEYHIYYRDELWQGSKEYTVLQKSTRSCTRLSAKCTREPNRRGRCAGRPTALRRRC